MRAADYFLGIDGGGTRCRARIRAKSGAVLAEAEGGPANVYQDFDGALANVVAVARQAAQRAGMNIEMLSAGLGLAGVTDAAQSARVRRADLPFASLVVDSDSFVACLGAHAGEDGGIVIAGTGSAGLALVNARRISIGGHGFVLGDHGSGAVMGRAALQHALLAHDGIAPHTKLSQTLMTQFADAPAHVIAWSRAAQSRDYASFAPQVIAAAALGDPVGLRLVGAAIQDLAHIAHQLKSALAPRLSLIGGLGGALLPYFPPDVAALFAPALADPLDGAILMARRQEGTPA